MSHYSKEIEEYAKRVNSGRRSRDDDLGFTIPPIKHDVALQQLEDRDNIASELAWQDAKNSIKMSPSRAREKIVAMLEEVLVDVMQVFDFGAKKHPDSGTTPNFLMEDGNKCQLKVRGKSVLGHAAASFCNPGALDDESNLPHLLHLLSSSAILYIRHKRDIVHPDDREV